MLERLLSIITTDGVQTTDGLARRLGVTAGLVEMMLADLQHMGYIRDMSCGSCCSGCGLAGECSHTSSSHLWTLSRAAS